MPFPTGTLLRRLEKRNRLCATLSLSIAILMAIDITVLVVLALR